MVRVCATYFVNRLTCPVFTETFFNAASRTTLVGSKLDRSSRNYAVLLVDGGYLSGA